MIENYVGFSLGLFLFLLLVVGVAVGQNTPVTELTHGKERVVLLSDNEYNTRLDLLMLVEALECSYEESFYEAVDKEIAFERKLAKDHGAEHDPVRFEGHFMMINVPKGDPQ